MLFIVWSRWGEASRLILDPAVVRDWSMDSSYKSCDLIFFFFLFLRSWPTAAYPTGSISERIMYHWHLHHKPLKYIIKDSPLDISIEVVFKEKYEEENSPWYAFKSGTTLLKSRAKIEIRLGNFIFWLRKQDCTKGLIYWGGKPSPYQMFLLIW